MVIVLCVLLHRLHFIVSTYAWENSGVTLTEWKTKVVELFYKRLCVCNFYVCFVRVQCTVHYLYEMWYYMSKDFSNEKSTTTTTVTTYSASNRAVWLLFMLAYVDLFYVDTLKHTMLNRENYSTQTKRHTVLKWYKTLKRLNPIIFCLYFLVKWLRRLRVLFHFKTVCRFVFVE